MSEIKRYRADIGGDQTVWPVVVPDIEGSLCYYHERVERIAAAEAQVAELQARLREMTTDRNLWRDAHNEDCPNLAQIDALRRENATERHRFYRIGFEDCRAQALHVVDEHDGYGKHIVLLEPTLTDPALVAEPRAEAPQEKP